MVVRRAVIGWLVVRQAVIGCRMVAAMTVIVLAAVTRVRVGENRLNDKLLRLCSSEEKYYSTHTVDVRRT